MRLAQEGKIFIFPLAIATVFSFWIYESFNTSLYVPLAFVALLLFCLNFFRDPIRVAEKRDNVLVSPADGKIIRLEKINDPELGACNVVSIFLSIFDVHVNRMPISGKFTDMKYFKGEFLMAFDHKACDLNERNTITISTKIGKIKMIQIAGLLARRIICYAYKNNSMKIGDRLGFMRFGSRIDLILPQKISIDVKLNQKVIGNQTVIGTFES